MIFFFGQTDRPTDRQTNRQTERYTDIVVHRKIVSLQKFIIMSFFLVDDCLDFPNLESVTERNFLLFHFYFIIQNSYRIFKLCDLITKKIG